MLDGSSNRRSDDEACVDILRDENDTATKNAPKKVEVEMKPDALQPTIFENSELLSACREASNSFGLN